MAVFLYQVGIFTAIIIASFFGKKSRNTAVILISIFTILQVYMSWLLLLQFVTIFIAYSVSNNITEKKTERDTIPRRKENSESEFADRNQELEHSRLNRLHTKNILTTINAPSKPFKPFNPQKDKPNILSRFLYVILLIALTAILSYMIPLAFLVEWLKTEYEITNFQFLGISGILFSIIQVKYYIDEQNKFNRKKERYKTALAKYNDKLKIYKSEMGEYEKKNKSLRQIEIENAELERKMSELKNKA